MLKQYVHLFGILILSLFFIPFNVTAQTQQINYGAETAVYAGSNNQLPFWFYANTYGRVDGASANLINRFYSRYTYQDTSRSLKFSTGFDIDTRLSSDNTIFFNQLYGKATYHWVSLSAGRFYDPMGLNDDDLTMGSTLVSRNATPVPKIRLGTDGFVNLPWTNGRLQLNAMTARGWFSDNRYIKSPYLHQKFLYLRYKHERFDITAGVAHNVMWAGTQIQPYYQDLPDSFSDYLRVAAGKAASGNVPANDTLNVIGNNVAAYEVKLGINFNKFRFKAYRQFYLEDKVSLAFRSPWDGLWGAGIEFEDANGIVTEILWEHLNTKRQNSFDFEPKGRTNYYNNGLYRSGWTYEGRILGNPLVINRPVANFNGGWLYPITNNIIIAHHVGIQGKPTSRLKYKAMLTYSRNYGTHYDQGEEPGPYVPLDQLRRDEYSSLLQANYLIAPNYGLSVQSALAFDIGELYENNRWGFQIGVRWDGVGRLP